MTSLIDLLQSIETTILDASLSTTDFIPIDLSVDNNQFQNIDVSSSEEIDKFINHHIKINNAKVAYGGYLEKRNIYKRSVHFSGKTEESKERNIHLGLDIWQNSGTNIFSPIDGTVHSFKNNQQHGDYGPTIILEHHLNNTTFYTLYGHLSVQSINGLYKGQTFKTGEILAQLGNSSENGDYAPHLHFQIIDDIKDYDGDYPGVCSNENLAYYKQNCPDPNILLNLK